MASAADDILEYMLLVWNLLTLTPVSLKNPVHAMVLATRDLLEQLLSDSLLVFAPGLLDVLQPPTPPSVAYFKGLPTDANCWGVYLLVLEKPGCRPKIYVGSGTDKDRGVARRFQQYDSNQNLKKIRPACFGRRLHNCPQRPSLLVPYSNCSKEIRTPLPPRHGN